jgi:hypothetical protein
MTSSSPLFIKRTDMINTTKTNRSILAAPARNPNVSNYTVNALPLNPCAKNDADASTVRTTLITSKHGQTPFKPFCFVIPLLSRLSSRRRAEGV